MSRLQKISMFLLVLALFAPGCGQNDSRSPASFSGTVTLDGQPLKEGSVQFTSPQTGESAYANLDSAGHFKVEFPHADVGANYEVTVGPPVSNEESVTIESMNAASSKTTNQIPARYGNRSTSKLTATLSQTGENTVNFDLTTKAK